MAKSTFTKMSGRSTFHCQTCGRLTRDVDQGGTDLCPECYELAGMDNEINDDGRKPTDKELEIGNRLLKRIAEKGGQAGKAKASNGYLFFGDDPAPKSTVKETTMKTKKATKTTKPVKTTKAAKPAADHTHVLVIGKGSGMYVAVFTDGTVQATTNIKGACKFENLKAAKEAQRKLKAFFRTVIISA